MTENKYLLLLNSNDKDYIHSIKVFFKGAPTYLIYDQIQLLSHLSLYCKQREVKRVVTTSTSILQRLVEKQAGDTGKEPKLSNYAGSMFEYESLEILFIDPLAQLRTIKYGSFLTARYISKFTEPNNWCEPTPFTWEVFKDSRAGELYALAKSAFAIAFDIETFKRNLAIRCIAFSIIHINRADNRVISHSVVVPLDSLFNLTFIRNVLNLPVQKITQKGKYDVTYLLRYNCIPSHWMWDTANLMHCWYSELPKDLGFLNAFFLRKVTYWKDLAETNDLYEYYKYNALDSWATGNIWIQQLLQLPDWARRNYLLEFPVMFPALLAELTGIKRDVERLQSVRSEVDSKEKSELKSLTKMVGFSAFNPGSPKQVLSLIHGLGHKHIESTNEKDLKKAALEHPITGKLVEKILEIRGLRKLATTYLRTDNDADKSGEGGSKEFFGRVLYTLNPDGTDTGRLASKEHHFWCGLQIQNIPRGVEVKSTLCADDGFYLGEADLEQAESRDTAYISGDENLINAVSGSRDFHSVNASSFFGVSYESIYDDAVGKTKDKKLRDLAKRVNHGANYNMGPAVLVDTMGLDKIWEAKRLLKLEFNEPKAIAQYLLARFHATYKGIANDYYKSVIFEVASTCRLTSRVYHHGGKIGSGVGEIRDSVRTAIESGDWTRYCFGNPEKNKLDLNAYVAHCPQSLNARTLNEAFLKVFYEVALPNAEHFRLHAQIHDSILFSYKPERSDLPDMVRERMEIPVTVRNVLGNYSTFTVPAALKLGTKDKPAKYWSETE